MMLIALVLLALALLFMVACIGLLALWVARDAKSRGLNVTTWVLVVLLVPNLIGLLLYFLVGRREERYSCPNCGKGVLVQNTFCPWCGTPIESEAREKAHPTRQGKGLIVGAILCAGFGVLLFLGSFIGLISADRMENGNWTPSLSTFYVESNWGDSWNVRFHYTNTSPTHSFQRTTDGPNTLSYTGSSESGPLTLRVYQNEVERTVDLSGEGATGSLDLSIFQPGKLYLELDNNNGEGKNVVFTSSWE